MSGQQTMSTRAGGQQTDEERVIDAFALWAQRHPEPTFPIFRRSGQGLTPGEMAEEMQRGTAIGRAEITRFLAVRDSDGGMAAFAELLTSFATPALDDALAEGARTRRERVIDRPFFDRWYAGGS